MMRENQHDERHFAYSNFRLKENLFWDIINDETDTDECSVRSFLIGEQRCFAKEKEFASKKKKKNGYPRNQSCEGSMPTGLSNWIFISIEPEESQMFFLDIDGSCTNDIVLFLR